MKQLLQYQILMDSTEEIKLQTIHHQASPVTAHCGIWLPLWPGVLWRLRMPTRR